jgi:hypothetical protein
MLKPTLAAAALGSLLFASGAMAQPQDDAEEPTRLEDLTVIGRPLQRLIESFVTEVAAPNQGRSLARWRNPICVSTVNIEQDGAQYIIDRVAEVADRVNVRSGGPHCSPNVVVVASADATNVAHAITERSPLSFRPGSSTTDQGAAALRAFRESAAPVRWWHVSFPVDRDTNLRAVRLPGDPCGDTPVSCAPAVKISASNLTTQIVDNLQRVIIVVDSSQLAGIESRQLADYIAFVALAQIDPQADTSRYVSVLNTFDKSAASGEGMTEWDYAYLEGLYKAQMTLKNTRAGNLEIAQSIHRAHNRLADTQAADPSTD